METKMEYTLELAFKSFCGCFEEPVRATVIDPFKKAIVYIPAGHLETLRQLEHHIFHGQSTDVFTFTCLTGTSGILEYDEVLSDEWRYKCM